MNYPTADQVALAIVEAARLHGDDALSIARGGAGSRGRVVAYAALCAAVDGVNKRAVARCCGFTEPKAASSALLQAQAAKWWSEYAVDEIVGQLVGDAYDDGEPAPEPAIPPPAEPRRRVLPFATMHFDSEERRLIARMWNGGANAAAIGAALGADADQIRNFARDNPQLCPERQNRGAA